MRCKIVFGAFLVALVVTLGWIPSVGAADPNSFIISNFEADYYLGRDAAKASTLRVKEKITAEFPQYDQNHGIERALPESYDAHSLRLKIGSVKDVSGRAIPYETRNESGNAILRIGEADTYVRGTHTYLIDYSYQNVTKNFTDHDEIFWDTNGTQWQQPFQNLTARVHIDKAIAHSFTERFACYIGKEGSKEQCEGRFVTNTDGSKTVTFKAPRLLQGGENLSFVAGFQKDTFSAYVMTPEERFWQTFWSIMGILWTIAAVTIPLLMTVLLVRIWRQYGRSPKGRETIVPEYLPPKGVSVLMAGQVTKAARNVVTAQLIDFAVRHYIKIYEVEKGKLFKKKTYELEIIKALQSLRTDEVKLFEAVFGQNYAVGKKINLDDIARKKYSEMTALNKYIRKEAETEGYFVRHRKVQTKYYIIGTLLIVFGAPTLLFPVVIMGIVTLAVAGSLRPRTEKGVALVEYIEGLKQYLKLAEAERLRVLQSPSGAEKVNVDDKKQLVKLYERVLPYAILLGIEKEWGKQFTELTDQAPDWYVGSSPAFNAAIFAGSLNGFTSAASSTFSSPSSSSSSGFSGGSSGGGGGGGGGGGW